MFTTTKRFLSSDTVQELFERVIEMQKRPDVFRYYSAVLDNGDRVPLGRIPDIREFMYMRSEGDRHFFKHCDTRDYLVVDVSQGEISVIVPIRNIPFHRGEFLTGK